CDRLVRFAHWITPERMPKRYDTHFYIAQAPEDHVGVHDGHESVDSVWITPRAAMEAGAAGERTVIFPTFRNLALLARYRTTDEAMAATRERRIVSVTPWTEHRADGNYICIPEEAGYDISEEKLSRPV
ncbi:MAG: NUDIX hydrolase, partial [Gammaproteobacteria bacterium]